MESLVLQIIYISYGLQQITALSPYVVDLDTVNCKFDPNICSNATVQLITVNNRKVVNGSFIFAIDINQFEMTVVCMPRRRRGRQLPLINMAVNGCEFISNLNSRRLQLSTLLMAYIFKSTKNLPKKCPVKSGTEVLIENMYVDAEQLPPYLPEVAFICHIGMTYNKASGFQVTVTGSLVSKEKDKMRKT